MFTTIGTRSKPEDLVSLLLECHKRIRMFSRLAEALGRRDDLPAEEVIDAAQRCERYFSEALPLHIEDEEQSLLPRLQEQPEEVQAALATMHAQHVDHAVQLSALLQALRALRAEPKAPHLRERLLAVAAPLVEDFEQHLLLEESVIFPAVRVALSPATQIIAMEELRARRRHPSAS